jgi:hypothetical protein
MIQKCVSFLRKRDESTDAVEKYCRYIGKALTAHDSDSLLTRMIWAEQGCGLPVIPFARSEQRRPSPRSGWFSVLRKEC